MKEHIFKQYPYRIELHAHTTPASSCSNLKPEELVQLYHEKGYDGLVITNHYDPDKLSLGKVEAVAMLLRDFQAAKKAAKKVWHASLFGYGTSFSGEYERLPDLRSR